MNRQNSARAVQFFSTHAAAYLDPQHLSARAAVVRRLVAALPTGLHVLDIGCGDGSMSLPLLERFASLTLVDPAPPMLARARAAIPIAALPKVLCEDSTLDAFSGARTYDLVLCLGVLAYVQSVPEAFRTLARLTTVGGSCIVQYTDADRPLGALELVWLNARRGHDRPLLQRIRSRDVLQQPIPEFRLEDHYYHALWMPGLGRLPAKWLSGLERLTLRNALLQRLAASAVVRYRRIPSAEIAQIRGR